MDELKDEIMKNGEDSKKIKLLIVDDEVDVCDFVKNFFKERNFHVLTALGGVDALRVVKKEMPNIILLDIRMKDMDGIEALRRIRQIDKTSKILTVTAVHEQDKMDEAYKLGAVNYITKPLILEELEQKVFSYAKEFENV